MHAMGFNRANVALLNDNLERLYHRDALTPTKIWNLDETGCITVKKPSRITASTGVKQVGAIVSAERGQLVIIYSVRSVQLETRFHQCFSSRGCATEIRL